MQEVIEATGEVNKHLASEVERLNDENFSLKNHIRRLTKHIKETKIQHSQTVEEEEEERTCNDRSRHEKAEPVDEEAETAPEVNSSKPSAEEWTRLQKLIIDGNVAIDYSDLIEGTLLGEGTYGKTYKGVWRGAECAIKKVELREGAVESFTREVQALACIRHPNVLALYGACVQPPESCLLVTEYLSGGSLNDAIHGKGQVRLGRKPLSVRLQILADVASGMTALEQHSPPIVHRDLKPSNVLLDGGLRAKVSDMGLARILDEDALVSLTPETGSYLYMAPEVVCHCAYATQADVWSWACLASEVLTLQRPYARRLLTPIQVAVNVAKGKIKPDIPPETPPKLAAIMQACFRSERTSRPTFSEISAVMNSVMAEQPLREKKARSQKWGQCF